MTETLPGSIQYLEAKLNARIAELEQRCKEAHDVIWEQAKASAAEQLELGRATKRAEVAEARAEALQRAVDLLRAQLAEASVRLRLVDDLDQRLVELEKGKGGRR